MLENFNRIKDTNTNDLPNVIIYSRGICLGDIGPGKYSAFLEFKTEKKEISGICNKTTVVKIKIMAVIAGLEALKRRCNVTVWSDCEHLVRAMEKGLGRDWEVNNWQNQELIEANTDLWVRLLLVCDANNVTFNFTKDPTEKEISSCWDELVKQAEQNVRLSEEKRSNLENLIPNNIISEKRNKPKPQSSEITHNRQNYNKNKPTTIVRGKIKRKHCPYCYGSGFIIKKARIHSQKSDKEVKCPYCNGGE